MWACIQYLLGKRCRRNNIIMQLQTYENSYRIRSHWHFIDSLTPKKPSLPHKKTFPSTGEKEHKEAHSPKTRQHSPSTEAHDHLAKLKDKSFVSRIKKEKEKHAASRQLIKQGEIRRKKEEKAQKAEKYQGYKHEKPNKKLQDLFPKPQGSQQKRDKIKYQEPTPKTATLKPKLQEITFTSKRRGTKPHKHAALQQQPASIQRGRQDKKERCKSMGEDYLSSPLQKYMYLSLEDEERIAAIHAKIKRLRVMDSAQ